ncbi:unnamed protein product [Darwinula stevensoni]|uniref:tRNA (carboxymethyluridine(34)-5-O)-methyltransferase n=1 Tax=Darwinula stevensoni TaxID=69355 RepID=A0A7R8X757_9CRUS|nr:unnamed protein product [Darwinula stevensoni]CAG0881960.1 unnamed protein product [Darwinula stevensoni]
MEAQCEKNEAAMDGVRSMRKADKKQRRSQKKILAFDPDLSPQNDPSPVLGVCNAGLMTGDTEESLLEVLSPYGVIRKLVMLPNSAFSIVEFHSQEQAEQAMLNLHGKIPLDGKTLYLTYLAAIPEKWKLKCKDEKLPEGLQLIKDFVSEEEEEMLLKSVSWDTPPLEGRDLKERQVRHYGYQFDYSTNNVNKDSPLPGGFPPSCQPVIDQLLLRGICPLPPDQLTVNRYSPGHGIAWHIDTHSAFESPILSLSLQGQVNIEFRHKVNGQRVSITLPPRSLLVMDGESRYAWAHRIAPRKTDVVRSPHGLSLLWRTTRTSFTFRRLRASPCHCSFPLLCDSQLSNDGIDSTELISPILEQLHVADVYEEIAEHFSSTRYKPWPRVKELVMDLVPGSLFLDVGCGNGKYFGLRNPHQSIVEIGCELSRGLAGIARDRGFSVVQGNMLGLPFRDSLFDACISIATLHHLASRAHRLHALGEMTRVLRQGGMLLVYVWAREQKRDQKDSSYLKKDRGKSSEGEVEFREFQGPDGMTVALPLHVNGTEFQHSDVLVPWTSKMGTTYRYYHVFVEGELPALCEEVPQLTIVQSYYDEGNWCVLAKKS